MSRTWTPSQLSAMETRGRTLLISAAAGSGKTATLTERIIRRVTDPQNPLSLSRLLIVTFTKAAAGELKERIAKALSDAIAADPSNRHLQNQLIQMGSAHISTIDAFCYQPVKEHFAESGMPASFRIADDAEMLPLRERIMRDLIDEFYVKYALAEADGHGEHGLFGILHQNPFADLCDSLSTFKNDENLFTVLNKFYNHLLNFPQGTERLKIEAQRLTAQSEEDFFLSDHGQLLLRRTREFTTSALHFYAEALEEIADDPAAQNAYGESLTREFDAVTLLDAALNIKEYSRARTVIHSFVVKNFKSCRNPLKDYTDLKKRRKKYVDEFDDLREDFYAATAEVISRDMKHMAEVCYVLYDFLHTFDQRLSEEKKRLGICDFSDNRRRLLEMLLHPDGTPTPLCDTFLGEYDEVYIDEYQDVDEVQDTIFRLIGGDHRFMVGDIKQSIYGFRGADPTVFARYRQTLPPLSEGASDRGNSIFMSENFRCDESVIRVTNAVCSHIFSACPESIGYLPQDDLVFSKKCPPAYESPRVQLVKITAAGRNDPKGPFSGVDAEAVYVANRIADLLKAQTTLADGSRIRPKDIAILMKERKHLSTFTAALAAMGIPTACEDVDTAQAAKDLLHGTDMIYLMNLLRVINNPDADIPLSEILRGEFPGMTLDQLITLRQTTGTHVSLYSNLEAYLTLPSADPELVRRAAAFVKWLEGYRALSTTLTAEHLLRLLRSDERVACRKSKAFMYLYESARTCRVAPFVGLYTFLNYFESKLLTEKKAPTETPDASGNGVVTLMTIHGSKGLEFPVCFVVGCGHYFKNLNSSADLVFEKNAGVSLKFYDRVAHKKYDNCLRKISSQAKYDQEKEDEMRVLYVAMTRARERLYLIGFSSDARAPFPVGDRYSALSSGSYMEWIKAGLAAHPEVMPFVDVLDIYEADIQRDPVRVNLSEADLTPEEVMLAEKYQRLQALKKTPSPLEELLRSVPTKVPASRMTDKLLDECVFYTSDLTVGDEDKLPISERGTAGFDTQSIDNITRALDLMAKGHTPDEFELLLSANARPTAAEKGTAAHMFLQYCDWSRVYARGIDEEIARLLSEGFMTERAAQILDRKQLRAFFDSPFAQRALTAKRMVRELKFQRFIPLRELTSDETLATALEDRTLYVRGSIDLLLEFADGHIELCDYKTDHITSEERNDPQLLQAHMTERHTSQLKQYAEAVEALYHQRPTAIYIYSMPFGDALEISI